MKKRKKYPIKKKNVILFVIVFLVTTLVITGVTVLLNHFFEKTVFKPDDTVILEKEKVGNIVLDPGSPFYEAFTDKSRINILVLGLSDAGSHKLADTIMLCSYNTKTYHLDIISIPRDTYNYRKGLSQWSGSNRINAVYPAQGVLGMATAVSDLLYGIPINVYATVEYDDIKVLIDAIGGVDINVPIDMKYDDPVADPPLHINFKKGMNHIDSSNVIELLRFRKAKGYNDFGRMEMQQTFLKAAIKKSLKLGNIPKLVKTATQTINSDITYELAMELASSAMHMDADSISSYTVPTYGRSTSETGGASFLFVKDEELYKMLEDIFIPSESAQE